MNIVSRVLTTPECGLFLPLAMNRARELYRVLERERKLIGARRYEVKQGRQGYYIDIRIQMPNVWILIDTKKCPGFVSGLVWVKDYFEPIVTVDEVDYLRTLFPRATPTTQADSAELASNGEQMQTLRASMFSGEMRKVVQVLLGMDVAVPYSPSASVTHGVYAATNGARWIIKISRDGVFAWPMMACYGKNNPTGLEYTPLPTPEPEEPRELLAGDVMTEALAGKGAFYSGCGWAFSTSGAKAANCFVGSEDMYSYAWQYQISITADPETGDPVSASLALLSEGYIHGPKTTHMKFPRRDIPGALYSFDPYRGNANYVNDCQAPVFCFFDGEALQTYYYVYTPSAYVFRSENYTDGRSSVCLEFEGTPLFSGDYYETPRPVIKLNSTQGESQISDFRERYLFTLVGPLGMGWDASTVASGTLMHEVWHISRESSAVADWRYNIVTNVLVVTGYEREAAYVAETVGSSNGAHRYWVVLNGYGRYYVRVAPVPCEATGAAGSIEAQVLGVLGQNYDDDSCQSGFRAGVLGGYWIVPGSSVGSTLTYGKQVGYVPGWDGCLYTYTSEWEFIAANINNVPTVDIDVPAKSSTDYKLSLHASGGMRAAVDATSEEIGDWMRFIELGMNDQTAFILRDAFKPTRCAYSVAVNKTRGFELRETSQFAPYDLSAVTGSTLAFVGVP